MDWKLYPITAFPEFIATWDALNAASGNTPLLESDFVIPLLEAFSSGDELLAICGGKDNPSAMAIVNKVKLGAWSTFQPSQAPIGMWLQKPGESLEELSQSLRKALPGIVLIFSVTQQDPDLLPRPEHSRRFSTLDYIETARVPIQGTFDDYWAKRSKNLRQNLRRQRNRLERENIKVELKVIVDANDIPACIKTYGELESAGWKAETKTAVNIGNTQGLFYQNLLTRFCNKKKGIVFQYLYDGTLVATDLCIRNDTQLIILKTTYDESITTSSPAMLMRQESFREIFEAGFCHNIEFYGKVMDWHTRWSQNIRTMYHTNTYIVAQSFFRVFQ